jgi:hypothetical protein
MRHPTEGVLRRLLDEPAGVGLPDREHVEGCSQCLARLTAVRGDAELVGAALATEHGTDVDVAAGWRRVSAAGRAARPVPAGSSAGRPRALLRRPVVAALAATVVVGGAAAAAANGWLDIFRTEQVAPVGISTTDLDGLHELPDLSAYGDVVVTGDGDVHGVPDAAAAAAETGLDVPEIADLPRGITGEPTYAVGGERSATFTFSADRATQAAAEAGEPLAPLPPGMDGSQVRLDVGPGVAQVWEQPEGVPALVVGRAVAPTAFASGVPFETVRDYVLSLPGVPEDVAAQLRTFNADGSTLPLPVPAEKVTTSRADVNGAPATVLTTHDRTMAAVVWVDDGVVTVVGGTLGADEVLAVARGLS